jgi:hypothetical protein
MKGENHTYTTVANYEGQWNVLLDPFKFSLDAFDVCMYVCVCMRVGVCVCVHVI